jgi:septum formation protein
MTRTELTLILASASPRRLELLGRLGLRLEVAPAEVDETPYPGESPPLHVRRIARAKALEAAARRPGRPVLAADTVVVLGTRILGKPVDRVEAAEMLRALAGRSHLVMTSVVVIHDGSEAAILEAARVTFLPLDTQLHQWYLATGEGDDKAGAYAVQGKGAILVERVEGNVQAVVGLPLAPLPNLFRRIGLELVSSGEHLVLMPSG